MKKYVNIAFLGGDDRTVYAARYLCGAGYEVGICAAKSKLSSGAVKIDNVADAIAFADVLVLPIPMTRDQISVASSDNVTLLEIINGNRKDDKPLILGGMVPRFFEENAQKCNIRVVDYAKDEGYLQSSAELTALAFWDFLKDKNACGLEGSSVAICGYGRIAKKLTNILVGRKTQIKVFSGRAEAHKDCERENVSFFDYKEAADQLCGCKAVINTAPAHVLDMNAVKSILPEAVFYELASAPFGIDEACASYLGSRYVKALGLPGMYYPQESGELIALSVIDYLNQSVCRIDR